MRHTQRAPSYLGRNIQSRVYTVIDDRANGAIVDTIEAQLEFDAISQVYGIVHNLISNSINSAVRPCVKHKL
jgi:hypothetical protein